MVWQTQWNLQVTRARWKQSKTKSLDFLRRSKARAVPARINSRFRKFTRLGKKSPLFFTAKAVRVIPRKSARENTARLQRFTVHETEKYFALVNSWLIAIACALITCGISWPDGCFVTFCAINSLTKYDWCVPRRDGSYWRDHSFPRKTRVTFHRRCKRALRCVNKEGTYRHLLEIELINNLLDRGVKIREVWDCAKKKKLLCGLPKVWTLKQNAYTWRSLGVSRLKGQVSRLA